MSVDPSLQDATADFKRGGWIVTLLGGAGMLARMLMTDQTSSLIMWIRKCSAACLVGVICYFALHDVAIPQIYKSILLSVSGMASPELMEVVLSRIIKYKQNEPTKKKSKRK
jgi:hypothetical protein